MNQYKIFIFSVCLNSLFIYIWLNWSKSRGFFNITYSFRVTTCNAGKQFFSTFLTASMSQHCVSNITLLCFIYIDSFALPPELHTRSLDHATSYTRRDLATRVLNAARRSPTQRSAWTSLPTSESRNLPSHVMLDASSLTNSAARVSLYFLLPRCLGSSLSLLPNRALAALSNLGFQFQFNSSRKSLPYWNPKLGSGNSWLFPPFLPHRFKI